MKEISPSADSSSSIPKDAAFVAQLRLFLITQCEPPRSSIPVAQRQESHAKGRALWTQEVDCMKLLAACPELGDTLFRTTLGLLDTLKAQVAALCREAGQTVRPEEITIRLTHVPALPRALPSLPHRGGELVRLCGSIVRMGMKRVVPHAYRLMCPRCQTVVEGFTHPYDRAAAPLRLCERPSCKKEELQLVGQDWVDYCECRLQPRVNQSGKLPRSLLVSLENELVTACGVGQFVEIAGMLHTRWHHTGLRARPVIEPTIWALHVRPVEAYCEAAHTTRRGRPASSSTAAAAASNTTTTTKRAKFSPAQFFASYRDGNHGLGVALAKSTCPQLSGLFAPRMAVLLASVNGASTAGKTALHVRSTIHVLFVGDPSTGKSQLLRFAASVAPRSTSTTGMGSTSAGLTVAATKEMGEFVLEPGALVLSDGGVCVIDELRTVSPADRASLHEAMEQQTISVAKGGLVTKLRTACSVMSACNPPPNRRGSRVTEIGVGGPLLSRFDFIFLLWDTHQKAIDERIAEHVLSCSVAYRHPDPPLALEELASYLWWVRAQYAQVDGPLLSDAAADLLARYFDIQRRRGCTPSLDDAVPVTIRFLESLVRITQAHAKLHMQLTCTIRDASMAVFLMERTAYSLKIPLRVLGEDLYSSSLELDDIFLRNDQEALERQDAVMEALVSVVQHYHTYSPSLEASLSSSTEAENASKNLLDALTTHLDTKDDKEREGSLLLQRRAEQLRGICRAVDTDSSHTATQESIRQLSREVSTAFTTPCSRTRYPSDPAHTHSTFSHPLKKTLFLTQSDVDLRATPPEDGSHPTTLTDTSEGSPSKPARVGIREAKGSPRDPSPEQAPRSVEPPHGGTPKNSVKAPARVTTSVAHADGSQAKPAERPLLTSIKRKRTADDIMQSLRFKF